MATSRVVRVPGQPATAKPATAEAASAPPAHDAPSDLPNAIDVDARFLRGPVMTKQGYVCPDEAWQKANPEQFRAALAEQD